MTYSIVARDPSTGEMGVAVQSHYFSVGSVVTWGEAGIGVVATQAFADPSYGPLGLDLMRAGKTATDALTALIAVDQLSDRRQVAMLDAAGTVATHTGKLCIPAAGHETGEAYSVQANMMFRDTVWPAMAKAFDSTDGDLALRLLAALDAAEDEAGDIRGRQSAAMLVVRGERAADPYAGRVLELRVEDHSEPLVELRRLLSVKRAYERMNSGDEALGRGDIDAAAEHFDAAQRAAPDNVEFTFWRAVRLASLGRIEEARTFLDRTNDAPGEWTELMRRLPAAGMLSEEIVSKLGL